jgi:hypothetical protein
MARKITSGVVGRAVLGNLATDSNRVRAVAANTNISLEPSGTGILQSTKDLQLNSASSLRLADSDSSNFVALKSPATVASNITYTLPGTLTTDYFLKTDSSGNLSWAQAAVAVTNQTADTATYYPTITTATSGTLTAVSTSSTKLTFQPSSGTLTTTAFNGTSATLSGTLTAASIVETSSITLKENIKPINNPLEALLQLNGVTYDRKDKSALNEAGFLAEEVERVLPNLVVKDEWGRPYGINYTKFSAYLIEAVKVLVNEIETLKGKK